MKLLGLVLLIAVLVVGFRQVTTPPSTPVIVSLPVPQAPRADPPTSELRTLDEPAPSQPDTGYGGACRSTSNGKLENSAVFGGNDLVQVDYWTAGQPERSVLLPGGMWSRPSGMGGTYWVWVGCTFDQARGQVDLAINRRRSDGASHAGWGDPGLFSPAT